MTEVTELSVLHMFLGLKLVLWRFFLCHLKSAKSIPSIFAVWLVHVIMFILERKTQWALDYKLALELIFLQSDRSVTFVISVT